MKIGKKKTVAFILAFTLFFTSIPITFASSDATATDYTLTMLNDGADAAKFTTNGTGVTTVKDKSPDNTCYRAAHGGDWCNWTFKIGAGLPNLSSVQSTTGALVFWVDFRELVTSTFLQRIIIKDSTGAKSDINLRNQNDSKFADTLSTADGSLVRKTVTSTNGSGIAAGYVGWIIIPLDAGVDYTGYDSVYIARSGYIDGDVSTGKYLYFDNFAYVSDYTAYGKHNLHEDGFLSTSSSNTAISINVNDTYTSANVSWQPVASTDSYVVNLYNISTDRYVFSSTKRVKSTSAQLSNLTANTNYAVQVISYSSNTIKSVSAVNYFYTGENMLLNNGTNTNNLYLYQLESKSVDTGYGLSPDLSYYKTNYYQTGTWSDWAEWRFNISAAQTPIYNVEAYSIWVDLSDVSVNTRFYAKAGTVTDISNRTQSNTELVNNNVIASGSSGDVIYFISTVDESVTTRISDGTAGVVFPTGFIGYVVFPVINNSSFYNFATVNAFTLYRRCGYSVDPADNSKALYFDNVTAIRNLDQYVAAYNCKYGTMKPTDGSAVPTITSDAEVTLSAVTGAATYDLNFYEIKESDLSFAKSVTIDSLNTTVSELTNKKSYILQVIARNGSTILSKSPLSQIYIDSNFINLNDGTAVNTTEFVQTSATGLSAVTGIGVSPDNAYVQHMFYTTPSWNGWMGWNVNVEAPASNLKGVEAYSYWLDFSNINNTYYWGFTACSSSNKADELNGVFYPLNSSTSYIYLISAIDGSVSQVYALTSGMGGYAIPARFVGYVVIPTMNTPDFDYSTIKYLYWHRRVDVSLASADCGQYYYTDNYGAILDLNKFLANTVYTLGTVKTPASAIHPEIVSLFEQQSVMVSWNAISNATSYLVNLYKINGNTFTLSRTSAATDKYIFFAGLDNGQYAAQVIAKSGTAVLSNSYVTINEPNIKILNDGTDILHASVQSFQSVSIGSGIGISPDNSFYSINYYTNYGANDWGKVNIDTTTVSDLYGVDAYTFWVDASAMTGSTFLKPQILDASGNTVSTALLAATSGTAGTYYKVSAITGSYTQLTSHDVNGISVESGFVGYIVLPVASSNDVNYNYKNIRSLKLSRSGYVLTDAADGGKSLLIDNAGVILDLDAYLQGLFQRTFQYGLTRNSTGAAKPSAVVKDDDQTVTVSWGAVPNANHYFVCLYQKNNAAVSLVNMAHVTGTSAIFNKNNAEVNYIVQVTACKDAVVINTSALREFTMRKHNYFNIVNDASRMESIISGFTNTQVTSGEFPDGKGLSLLTTRNASIEFCLDEPIDIADYDAIAFYLKLSMSDSSSKEFTFANATKEIAGGSANYITNVIPASGVYGISAKDGQTITFSKPEANAFKVPSGFAGYVVMPIEHSFVGNDCVIDSITLWSNNWHTNSNSINIGQQLYMDNLTVINDLSAFSANVSDPANLGYLKPSSNAAIPTVSITKSNESSALVTWTSVAFATGYRVNVFDLYDGKPEINRSLTTTVAGTAVDISLTNNPKLMVQVTAYSSTGTVLNVSEIAGIDITDLVPQIQDVYFNFSKQIRFLCAAPSTILSGYNIVSYGTMMIPTQNLNSELSLETPNLTLSSFSETPAANTTYYSFFRDKQFTADEKMSARTYITYADSAGNEFTLYGIETISKSVSDAAREKATDVFVYPESKSLINTYTSAVPAGTTAAFVAKLNPQNISGSDLADFLLSNPNAEAKAAQCKKSYGQSDSKLSSLAELKYSYETDSYIYGINKYGKESISYKDFNGNYYDVTQGGGSFNLLSSNSDKLVYGSGISSFLQTQVNGETALTVTYSKSGIATAGAVLQTTYIFHDKTISVSALANYSNSSYTISASKSSLNRIFLNQYNSCKKTFNCDWIYPTNGDYPYKNIESWVTIHNFDSQHMLYTYNRGNIPQTYWDFYNRYPDKNIPVNFTDGNTVVYTLTYDLVLEKDMQSNNTDCIALFEGRGSNFASMISPVNGNDDKSTLFKSDSVTLNINVENIVKNNINYSIDYTVMDYYGHTINSYSNASNALPSNTVANRQITISASSTGYGMYFLNLKIETSKFTYQEYYPFALLDNYNYTYTSTSPFGINQILPETNMSYDDSFSICQKIGIAKTRGAFMSSTYARNIEFLEKCKNAGIKIVAQGGTNTSTYDLYGNYFTDSLCGNELNMAAINGSKTLDQAFTDYYNNYFLPGYNMITQQYGKNHVIAGVAAGQASWYQKLYTQGLWNQFQKISVHCYGIPYAPDNVTYKNDLWSAEGGLIRTVNAINSYGSKPFMMDETGYHTSNSLRSVCLRTQADYNTRCFILGLRYGAEYVGTYCFLDYSNSGVGTNLSDMEYNFGNFYYPDYYGRVIPKPAGIAFAMMTRQLESVSAITESLNYSTGTVRAFVANTALHGNVTVAWSNCSKLGNDTSSSSGYRQPTMPWQNQWTGSQNVVFNASGSTVTVTDILGKDTVYSASGGKVTIPLTGSPVYIKGVY